MELNNLKQEAYKLRLTPEEKQAMRRQIFGVPTTAPNPSPYFFFSYQFIHARVLAPAMVLLVVFVGAGTAAAAQGSLPGDFLYPVKVSINESIEVALATTPVARAEVSAKVALRRVEEAEALAAKGTLTPETGEALAANFEEHAQDAHESAQEVEAEDPAAATELRTNLDSSLSAHGAILATLSGGTSASNQEGTDAVAARVLARVDATPGFMRAAKVVEPQATMLIVATDASSTEDTTVSLEDDMIEATEDVVQAKATVELQGRAGEAMASARERFDANKKNLSSATITRVSGEFADVDRLLGEGSTTLARFEYAEATEQFTEALKKSVRLNVLLKAQNKIERDIITPILDADDILDDLDVSNDVEIRIWYDEE